MDPRSRDGDARAGRCAIDTMVGGCGSGREGGGGGGGSDGAAGGEGGARVHGSRECGVVPSRLLTGGSIAFPTC